MKKKILFIQQNLQGGGAEKVLTDLLNNFDYTQYEVDLVVLFKKGVYLSQLNQNVKVLFLMGEEYPKVLAMLRSRGNIFFPDLFLRLKLLLALRKKEYDSVISFMEGISTKAHYWIRNKAKKNISWVHTDLIKNNWCTKSFSSFDEQKKIYQIMDEIVFVSNDAKASFQQLFQISKGIVIYNIIDADAIKKKANAFVVERGRNITIVSVGRLIPVKNQKMIIEAAYILKKKGKQFDFIIVGEGQEKEKLKKMTKELNLEENFNFVGFQSNPYPYIKASDIFVLSSLTEGFPLVICEAMCLGKPILSTNTTGPSELLCNGVGFLSEIETNDFASKLEDLTNNKNILNTLSANALEASKAFSVEMTMNKIYTIL